MGVLVDVGEKEMDTLQNWIKLSKIALPMSVTVGIGTRFPMPFLLCDMELFVHFYMRLTTTEVTTLVPFKVEIREYI